MREIIMPALGVALEEALVLRWHKVPGDRCEAGEVVAEVETDKSDVEIESPVSGTLLAIVVPAGETVAVGRPMGTIEEDSGGDAPEGRS